MKEEQGAPSDTHTRPSPLSSPAPDPLLPPIHTQPSPSPLLLVAAAAPPLFLEPLLAGASAAGAALAANHVFMAGFWAWAAAQVAKVRERNGGDERNLS